MKIGIMGASGTLGRVFVRKLAESDLRHDVCCLLRKSDPDLERLAECIVAPEGVLSQDAVRRLARGRDVVINLAARNPEGQSADLANLSDFLAANAVGPALAAAICAAENKPLLHFSSVAVYETAAYEAGLELDERRPLPTLDEASVAYFDRARASLMQLTEDIADMTASKTTAAVEAMAASYPEHASVYGLSKLLGERAVVNSPVKSLCIRLSDVFGPGHESRGVIVDHLRATADSPQVEVNLDFRKTAYFIVIDDALSAALTLAEKLAEGEPMPPVVNLVGHRLDEPALAEALRRLTAGSTTVAPQYKVAAATQFKFDRRYDSATMQRILPDFELTALDDSLARTWSALSSESSST